MLLIDTETAMPPDWKPAYRGQVTDPLHARIWQIAMLDAENGVGDSWLVNPGFPIPPENRQLSNIDDELHARIMAAPPIESVLPVVYEAILCDPQVIAYNAGYDRRVIIEEDRRTCTKLPTPTRQIVWGDALVAARSVFPTERHLKLRDLARLLGISMPEDMHTALTDLGVMRNCLQALPKEIILEWWQPEEHAAFLAGDLPLYDMTHTRSLIYGGTLSAINVNGAAMIGHAAGGMPDQWVTDIAWNNGCEWARDTGHPWLERAWIDWLNSATPNE